jgi:ectoine hydroxylase-related dioxygenase (phytanoyl-CoA dioxygenase family)
MDKRSTFSGLETQFRVTDEEVTSFRHNGHVVLRNVASKEDVGMFRPLLREVVQKTVERQDTQGRVDDYSALFQQVTNVWRQDPGLRAFIHARRFAGIAATLLGVPSVRLYHDQALFKPSGGKPTPWHQDQFYWPLDTDKTITMWMPVVDATRSMGTMSFASGSHTEGALVPEAISQETHRIFKEVLAQKKFPIADYELKAGDATFHAGWTVHSAHGNESDHSREVITIIYFADGAHIVEPDNQYRKADMEVFLPGQRPGDRAGSPLNPVLFP